jgi:hypothetical protein
MKFLRQNFVSDAAELVPSLLRSLTMSSAGPVSFPPQPVIGEPHDRAGRTDHTLGVSCFR